MKKFVKKYYGYALALSLVGVFIHNSVLKERAEDLEKNQKVLLSEVENYRTKDSLQVAQVGQLILSQKELKNSYKELYKLLKTLKGDKVESVTTTNTETNSFFKEKVRDSIVYRDRDTLQVKVIHYNDSWTRFDGVLIKDSLSVKIQNRDSLLVVTSIEKKKFLGIKMPIWLSGYRRRTQQVLSKNPNTKVENVQFITIK